MERDAFLMRFVRRWLGWIVLGSLACGLLVLGLSMLVPRTYAASTTLIVGEGRRNASQSSYEALLMSERLTRTYAELLRKRPLLETVVANLGLDMSAAELERQTRVSTVRDTQLIVVTVRAADPAQAAAIANEMVRVLAQHERQMLVNGMSSSSRGLSIAEPAWPDPRTVQPQLWRNALLGLVFGAFLMTGIAYLRDSMDDRIWSSAEAETVTGAPILATISRTGVWQRCRAVEQQARGGPLAEAFQLLRTRIELAPRETPLRTLLVTSADVRAGRSSIAAQLATAVAQAGRRVILIDADLRRPTLHTCFDLPNDHGLATLFAEPAAMPLHYLQATASPNLSLLASGPAPANPAALLGSERMHEILAVCAANADIVIIDSPALLGVADATLLARQADATLLVVREGVTRAATLSRAYAGLQHVGVTPLGLVMSGARSRPDRSTAYYAHSASRTSVAAWGQPAETSGEAATGMLRGAGHSGESV